ncbi:uncharacterized protein [Argopecten irradians]|uniref:uncharacterized protein n=1 Tax=Argopecten irradians TaxID=31199 RepID=UPI0037207CCA
MEEEKLELGNGNENELLVETENETREELTDEQQHVITEEKLKTIHDDLKTKPAICFTHKEKEVCLFCRSCEKLVCTTCVIDRNHASHELCEIEDVIKTKLQELGDEKENMRKSLQQNIRIIKNQRNNVSENCKMVSKEIDDRKNYMIQEVEAWSINLQSVVREHQRKRHEGFEGLISESETCLTALEIFERNPDYDTVLDGKKLIHVVEMLKNNTGIMAKEESEASEGKEEILFISVEGVPDKMGTLFGQVAGITPVDNLQKGLKFKFCNSLINFVSPFGAKRAFVVTERQLYLVDLTKAKYKREELEPLMSDVVYITPVTSRGIYVQKRGSSLIHRITTDGQVYHFANLDTGSKREALIGIRLTDTGMLASVTKSEVSTSYRAETKLSCNIKITKHTHHGIKEKEIVSLNCPNDKYLYKKQRFPESVHTASGIYIQTTSMDNPKERGSIQDLNSMQSFSYSCKCMYTGCIGSNPAMMFHPSGLCKDEEDQLIVADYWNHAVHQLTPDGKFKKFLIREENGLTHPTAVGIASITNWIWVGQEDGSIHSIKYIS